MLYVLLPVALVLPLLRGIKLPRLSRRGKLAILALAVAVPALCLAAFFSLVSSVQVYGQVKQIELLGVEGDQLNLCVTAEVGSTTPVGIEISGVRARLFVGYSELGEAHIIEPVRLEPGRTTEVEIDVYIWNLDALGDLLSEGLAGRKPVVRAEVEGTVRTPLFFSFRAQRTLEVPVPFPSLEELFSIEEVSLSEGLEARASVSFKNPYKIMFELRSLDLSLYHGGEKTGRAVLAEPVLVRPCCRVSAPLNVTVYPGAVQLLVDSLTDDWALEGSAKG
ncbi:hypothetical protein DRO33_04850, partial [Candidatus Bathyarchaeota archaeon]